MIKGKIERKVNESDFLWLKITPRAIPAIRKSKKRLLVGQNPSN